MSNILWDLKSSGFHPDEIQHWIETAARDSYMILSGVSEEQLAILNTVAGTSHMPWEIYVSPSGTRAVRVMSAQGDQFASRQSHEHRELLMILQEALIAVAEQDRDFASKLSARAYVNLKTDPIGQRRYDGLLHRFTGVLHRRSSSTPLDVTKDGHNTEGE